MAFTAYVSWKLVSAAICVYVDDAVLCDNDPSLRERFVSDLSARFPTEDKGELEWILNVSISRSRSTRTLTLSQELYVQDLVTKFGHLIDSSVTRKVDCPMDEGTVLSPDDQPVVGSPEYDSLKVQRDTYMSLVGGYLQLVTSGWPT